ncbi:hypothetical protein [Burkholderia cenocepacia]|uniref:hypothetical protein n=1 Tax=Burkholderia cenocepacia TaxID=95486 RepID=UPI002AB639DE|nr:hypothetical protein [Burkholderia cenocepacia]
MSTFAPVCPTCGAPLEQEPDGAWVCYTVPGHAYPRVFRQDSPHLMAQRVAFERDELSAALDENEAPKRRRELRRL